MPVKTTRKVTLSELGEFGLINRLKKQIGPCPSRVFGIGDDAAVAPVSAKKNLLFTTDMLVEGVHFTKNTPAKSVGHKAIAASISDIAAMGGQAKYAVISLGVPRNCPENFVKTLYSGIKSTAKKYDVTIVGGDTVQSPKVIINVAMTGEAKKADVVYRNGAKKGDHIYVTGPLGKSLSSGRHLSFTPRVKQSQYLVKKLHPTAMIDISDGLAADLGHILRESNVGAVIEEALLPGYRKASLNNILYDGEDFELLFTLSEKQSRLIRLVSEKGLRFYRIGTIAGRSKGLTLIRRNGDVEKIKAKGYTHF